MTHATAPSAAPAARRTGGGGLLDDDFINSQRDLQKLIVARMRSFGMVGVRPVRVPCEPARTCGASPLLSIRRARS